MSALNFFKKKEIFINKNLFIYLKWRKLILKKQFKSLKLYNTDQFFLLILYYFPFCFFFHFEEKDKKSFIDKKVNILEELHQEEEDNNKIHILTFNRKTISKIKFFKDFYMFSGTFLCVYSQKLESLLNFYEQKQVESGVSILFVKYYNRFVSLDYLLYHCFEFTDFFNNIVDFYQSIISNFLEYYNKKYITSLFNLILLKKNAN